MRGEQVLGVQGAAHPPLTKHLQQMLLLLLMRRVGRVPQVVDLVGVGSEIEQLPGLIPLVGRTEAEVSADLSQRILAEGHHRVNFAIVAAGENAASPHHEAGHRVIREGEIVLCDFGGTMKSIEIIRS